MEFLPDRGLDSGGPPLRISHSIPLPPNCDAGHLKFHSYISGSAKAQALEEVDKMLEKGTLELVDHPDPGFYSRLFLVQKVTGGWHPVIDLLSLNGFITLTKFKMEMVMVSPILWSIRKGDFMFSVDPKAPYF